MSDQHEPPAARTPHRAVMVAAALAFAGALSTPQSAGTPIASSPPLLLVADANPQKCPDDPKLWPKETPVYPPGVQPPPLGTWPNCGKADATDPPPGKNSNAGGTKPPNVVNTLPDHNSSGAAIVTKANPSTPAPTQAPEAAPPANVPVTVSSPGSSPPSGRTGHHPREHPRKSERSSERAVDDSSSRKPTRERLRDRDHRMSNRDQNRHPRSDRVRRPGEDRGDR